MKWKIVGIGILLFTHIGKVCGQQRDTLHITLDEALRTAQVFSLDAKVAKNTMLSAYWVYRNYKAELLPNLVLDGTLPSLNRSLSSYQKEDGSYSFVTNQSLEENLGLSINQNIPHTGGSITIQSQLQRIDQLGDNKSTDYMSVPISVSITQPLITARPLRWSMKIEPERYKAAMQQYCVDMEAVNQTTIGYYFDFLLAIVNKNIAEQNLKNATELLKIAEGKKKIGIISDNDLLQLELGQLNAEASVISADQEYEQKMRAFRIFLRYDEDCVLKIDIPQDCPLVDVDPRKVLEIAQRNNPLTHTIRQRLLESQQNIAQARVDRGFKADLFASVGYTGSNSRFSQAYQNLENRQVVSLGVRIPILDWGKGKGKVRLAKSQQEVVKAQVEEEQLNLEQDVMVSVKQYTDQAKLLRISQKADEVAKSRYQTAYNIFVMGKINVLDINSAQSERDNARRNYINQLYMAWLSYYNLRQLTLFDFAKNEDILYEMIKN